MFDDMYGRFDTIPACDGRTDGIVRTYAEHRALQRSGKIYRIDELNVLIV